MTTLLPPPRESVYQLSENLRDEAVLLGVRPAPPSEAEREELLFSKLGPKGWVRLHHFRPYYSAGWGDGSGKPLSPRALEMFYRFLELAVFTTDAKPSVFLTDQGCIELCWEDGSGKAVQLEFRPGEIFASRRRFEQAAIGALVNSLEKLWHRERNADWKNRMYFLEFAPHSGG